jgi:hypothetical protein
MPWGFLSLEAVAEQALLEVSFAADRRLKAAGGGAGDNSSSFYFLMAVPVMTVMFVYGAWIKNKKSLERREERDRYIVKPDVKKKEQERQERERQLDQDIGMLKRRDDFEADAPEATTSPKASPTRVVAPTKSKRDRLTANQPVTPGQGPPTHPPSNLSQNTAFAGTTDTQHFAFPRGTPDKIHPGAVGFQNQNPRGMHPAAFAPQPVAFGTQQKIVMSSLDTTGDGRVDTIAYDTNGDGLVDRIERDTNGDGRANVFEIDANHKGQVSEIRYDTNHDGQVDTIAIDTNGDGFMDRVDYDTNHDGTIDRTEMGGRLTRGRGQQQVLEARLYQINEFNID